MHPATGLFFSILVGVVFLILLHHIFRFWPRKKPATANSKRFQELSDVLYDSIKRYKGHSHYMLQNHYFASAESKFYKIRLTLSSRLGPLRVIAEIMCKHDLRFSLTTDNGKLKVERKNDSNEAPGSDEIEVFQTPLSFFEKVLISPGVITAFKTIPKDLTKESFSTDWPVVMGALVRFSRFIVDFDQRGLIQAGGDAVCPFCRSEISSDAVVVCKICMTRHHAECWHEAGRCSIFGCSGTTTLTC